MFPQMGPLISNTPFSTQTPPLARAEAKKVPFRVYFFPHDYRLVHAAAFDAPGNTANSEEHGKSGIPPWPWAWAWAL